MLTCHAPWHVLRSKKGEVTWFRRLPPPGPAKHHYRIGPVPADDRTVRFWGLGPDDQPLMCAACHATVDGSE